MNGDLNEELRAKLAVAVPDDLLTHSLTHRSYAYEHGATASNERLEFLGDAVLGIVVTEALYTRHPDLAEGHLARMRAATVNARALADVAAGLDLGKYLRLGKGENATGGRHKISILADSLEAVFGAVYLAAGMAAVRDLILRLLDPVMAATAQLGAGLDWKTSLQELTSRLGLGVPEYVISGQGPDHDKTFTAVVRLVDGDHGSGVGGSKKLAEQEAARATFEALSRPDAAEDA